MEEQEKKIPWHKKIYALYKGDEWICDGTLIEIAKQTGRAVNTMRFYASPCYHKRVEKRKRELPSGRVLLLALDDED